LVVTTLKLTRTDCYGRGGRSSSLAGGTNISFEFGVNSARAKGETRTFGALRIALQWQQKHEPQQLSQLPASWQSLALSMLAPITRVVIDKQFGESRAD